MPSKQKRKVYRKPYDWEKIVADWLTSSHKTVPSFAKDRGIPVATAKNRLTQRQKQDFLKNPPKEGSVVSPEIADSTNGAELIERRRVYISALERGAEIAEKIQRIATDQFVKMTSGKKNLWRSPSEAASIAIRASDQRRELSSEIQGIPRDDEDIGWQLTRGFWPWPYQRDFIFDTPATLKQAGVEVFVFAFVAGIGAGKTTCICEKAKNIAWRNRGLPGAIYAPTYRMLDDITQSRFMEMISDSGLSYRYSASKRIVTIFGDTPVMFRSMDDPEHLRGPEVAWAAADEIFQMPTRKAIDIVMGRIRHPDAKEPCFLVGGTPVMGWGYDLLVEEAETNKVQIYRGRTQDNLALDPKYYERLLKLYDPRFAKQELEGEWIDVHKGRAYWPFVRAYAPAGHILKPDDIPYRADFSLELCVDFNVSPMCWNVCQEFPYNGDAVVYCLDEIHIDDSNTEQTIKEFIRRYGDHKGGIRIWGDATGRGRRTSASRTDYEIILQGLEAAEIPKVEIRVGKSNPLQTDRVNSINGRLKNAKDEVRLFISEKCKETIQDFERVAFKPGTRELEKRKKADESLTHHTDALGYYIDRQFPVRRLIVRRR